MVVKLRLARHGRKNTPFYHLVAVNASKRRDALPLEKLGEYDPIPRPSPPTTSLAAAIAQSFHLDSKGRDVAAKEAREKRIVWDVERVRWWLGVGAQPTEAVVKLLERGGVLTGDHKWRISQARRGKGKPKEEKEGSDDQ